MKSYKYDCIYRIREAAYGFCFHESRKSSFTLWSYKSNQIFTRSLTSWNRRTNDAMYKSLTLKTQIAKFIGPTWGPPGSCRPQMGPFLAPWTCYQGMHLIIRIRASAYKHRMNTTESILYRISIILRWLIFYIYKEQWLFVITSRHGHGNRDPMYL